MIKHGTITGGVYHKKEKESGKLKMSGGFWTIPVEIIQNDECDLIWYQTEKAMYEIERQCAKTNGFLKVFQGEPKQVVPLDNWTVKRFLT